MWGAPCPISMPSIHSAGPRGKQPTCQGGLHRLAVVLLWWKLSAVAMPGTLRPPAVLQSRGDPGNLRTMSACYDLLGSWLYCLLSTQLGNRACCADHLPAAQRLPHPSNYLQGACCGTQGTAHCHRRSLSPSAGRSAAAPPLRGPATAGAGHAAGAMRDRACTISPSPPALEHVSSAHNNINSKNRMRTCCWLVA